MAYAVGYSPLPLWALVRFADDDLLIRGQR